MSSVPADLSSRPGTASESSSIDDFSSESEHDGTNVSGRKRKTGPLNDDGTKMNRDEITAYYRRLRNKLAAETAEAEALSPEARAQKQIDEQSGSILEHLKPRYSPNMSRTEVDIDHRPMIIVQTAPDHHTGAKCRLWGCGDTIKPYSYRLAIRPGTEYFRHSPGKF